MILVTTLLIAGIALAEPSAPCQHDEAGVALARLDRAGRLLTLEQASSDQLRKGFLALLDAVTEVAPPTGGPAGACAAKVSEARARMSSGSILDRAGVALIGECYRDTHGGRPFAVPAAVRSVADAREHIRRQVEEAQTLIRRGRAGEAAGVLLDAAMLIVTPIER